LSQDGQGGLVKWIGCLIRTLIMNKPSTNKLAPISGAKDFRWKLQMCWGNEDGLGVWSCAIGQAGRVEGEKGPTCAWSRGSVGLGLHIHTKG
jgi:hypothetical protein